MKQISVLSILVIGATIGFLSVSNSLPAALAQCDEGEHELNHPLGPGKHSGPTPEVCVPENAPSDIVKGEGPAS